MIDKSEAACRQLECAIRLIAANEDALAIHTLAMAAFGILSDLTAAHSADYEAKLKSILTVIGWSHLTKTANFLKHANRDPDASLVALDPQENDWRIGLSVLLYRILKGTFTPIMAAFHGWMLIRHPDEFRIAEDADKDFEEAYRDSIRVLKKDGRAPEMHVLNVMIDAYEKGIIPRDIGFARRPKFTSGQG
jgi:hypothetical protein